MNGFDDCIVAVSTPPGSGGIAIIRISGKDAFFIADRMFCASKEGVLSCSVSKMASHTIRHGYIFDFPAGEAGQEAAGARGELVDECLLSKMDAPKTYTAEDTVEINCHGGFVAASRVLGLALRHGARPAEPGEFTKRAFLNGRIDLAEAEGVAEVIRAKTEQSLRAAAGQLSGRLSEQIGRLCDRLVGALAEIEVSLEYPEYGMDGQAGENALSVITEVKAELTRLSETYARGRILRDGLRLVIAGKPNAGKSSLMNALAGHDRSIVTDIPGTTRDTVEEWIQLDGIPVLVSDTAGLRETEDMVERIGVERARGKLQEADLVLYMADLGAFAEPDASKAFTEPAEAFRRDLSALDAGKVLVLLNKADLDETGEAASAAEKIFDGFCCLRMSVLRGEGIEALIREIRTRCLNGTVSAGGETVITNERHKNLLDRAISLLCNAEESHRSGMPVDCITYDVRLCTERLGEIMGRNISDDVIRDIFSRFCVGK